MVGNQGNVQVGGPPSLIPTSVQGKRWRVNVVCLVGALLGIVSVFLVWVKFRVSLGPLMLAGSDLNLIDILNMAADSNESEATQVLVACILILVGTLIALLSSVGVIGQLIGIPLFLEWFLSESDGKLPSGAGPYVAIASAIIILVGMVKPVGPGYGRYAPGIKGRLLNFSSTAEGKATTFLEQGSQPHWVGKYCKYCGRPLAETASMCPGCGHTDVPPPDEPESDVP